MGKNKKPSANDGWGKVPTRCQQKKQTAEKKKDKKQNETVSRRRENDEGMYGWHRRTCSNRAGDWVALQPKLSFCLNYLLHHYPHIVYLGVAFWRRLLFLRPSASHYGAHSEFLLSKPHNYPVCCGAIGALKYLDLPQYFLNPPAVRGCPPMPLSLAALTAIEAEEEQDDRVLARPTSKYRVSCWCESSAEVAECENSSCVVEQDCQPRYSAVGIFLDHAICNNQVDCLHILLRDLQLSVTDLWYDSRRLLPDIDPLQAYEAEGKRTLLQLAAEFGTSHIVQLFIDYGAQVEQVDTNGRTALYYAARGGLIANLQVLIAAGGDVNSGRGDDGADLRSRNAEPLAIACRNVDPDTVGLLLHHGAHTHGSDRLDELVTLRNSAHVACAIILDPKAVAKYDKTIALLTTHTQQ